MKKILGIGNALVDALVRIEDESILAQLGFPKGSMTLIDVFKNKEIAELTARIPKALASGGSAANSIHGLAILGVETGFIGRVGDDEFGRFYTKDMTKVGISPMLSTSKTTTGIANAFITEDSERTFGTFLGAAVELSADDIEASQFKPYDILHIEGYLVQNYELIEKALKLAKDNNLLVSLDLASFNVVEAHLDFLKRVVNEYVDILFANEEEAKSFTGKDPEGALEDIAGMVDLAIVKLGAKGSMAKYKGEKFIASATHVNPMDTTGAGDLFASGFLYAFINGKPIDKALQTGAILGGKVIEVMGPKMSDDVWDEIKSMIATV
ncbi:MAG: adenosine kinase [Bacteroidales bacterium]|nr:adenosine kinase [Bacteroidales bacterium]